MDRDDRIERLLEEWCEEGERGETPDRDAFLAAHPDLAEELAQRLDAIDALDGVLSALDLPEGAPREIGEYRILREIGRGGMGVVYEAEQTSMRRRVALKVLSLAITGVPSAVKRFAREARAAGRLHHTNIVPIHAMGEHAGYHYYAMEMVDGRPLNDLIREQKARDTGPDAANGKRPPSSEAMAGSDTGAHAYYVRLAGMFAGVAEALDLAHDEGIVHRDIKPANLLLDVDGTLKIVDFGLARSEGAASMTMTGDLLGTPHYMSPEQAMAKRIGVDHRTDVYSLGATLYEVLTSNPPFRGKSLQELCSQIVTKDPVFPRRRNARIPRDLETIVLKAMEKDRDKRYATAGELARDLRRFAEGEAIRARRIRLPGRAWRKVKRHPVRAALVTALLLALAVGAGLALHARRAEGDRRRTAYADLLERAQVVLALEDGPGRTGHGDEARPLLSLAIAELPERPEAWWLRALTSGAPLAEQEQDLEAARERGLTERTFRLTRAFLHARAGRWDEARADADVARGLGESTPADALFEAELAFARGKREEAYAYLDAAVQETETVPSPLRRLALWRRARLRIGDGDLEGALADLHALREREGPASSALLVTLARVWHELGRSQAAERHLAEAIAAARQSGPDGIASLLWSCRHLAPPGWLERVWREVEGDEFDHPRLLAERARGLRLFREHEALAFCRAACQRHPGDVHLLLELGWTLEVAGLPEEALTVYERGLAADPLEHRVHEYRASLLERLGRDEEALEAFRLASELDPRCPAPHRQRGDILMDAGRLAEARSVYEQALSLDPRWRGLRANHATCLGRLGLGAEERAALEALVADESAGFGERTEAAGRLRRFDVGLEIARRHGRLEPWSEVGPFREVQALRSLGRAEEALSVCRAARERFPESCNLARAEAGILLVRERYDEALAALDRTCRHLPGRHADAADLRDSILARAGRTEEALASLRRRLESGPRRYSTPLQLAAVAWAAGHREEALRAGETATEEAPWDPRGWLRLGAMLTDLGRHERAVACLRRGLETWERRGLVDVRAEAPNLARARFALGISLIELGRLEEAGPPLEAAVAERREADFLNLLGWLRSLQGRNAEAIPLFREALALDPDHARAWGNLGRVLPKPDRSQEALDALDRSLALDGSHAPTHANRSVVLKGLGRQEEARVAAERAIELDATLYEAHNALAVALNGLGRREEALAAAETARRIDSARWQAHCNRGVALDGLGRKEEAIAAFDEAIAADGDQPIPWQGRGQTLLGLGRHEEALSAFDAALERGGDVGWLEGLRASTLSMLDRPEEALAASRRAIDAGSANPASDWHNRGVILRQLGRIAEAKEAYEKAVAIDSGMAAAHYNLGQILLDGPDLAGALRHLDAAREAGMDTADLAVLRFIALLHLGRLEEAAAALDLARERGAEETSVLHGRAMLLDRLERFEESVAAYRQLLVKRPGWAPARVGLSSALRRLGRFPEALAALDRGRSTEDPHTVVRERALVLSRLGRFEEALACFETVLAALPEDVDARYGRAWALGNLGRTEEALADFEAVLIARPENAAAHQDRATALFRLGRGEEALAALARAAALAPGNAAYQRRLARQLEAAGRDPDALVAWEAALAAEPEDLETALEHGKTLFRVGRHQEAATAFRPLADRAPRRGDVRMLLALAYQRLGRKDDALRAAREAARLEQPTARHVLFVAGVLDGAGVEGEAEKVLAAGLQRWPGDPGLHNNLAWLLANAGDPDVRDPARALRHARRAVAGDPENVVSLGTLGAALLRAGRFEESSGILRRAIALRADEEPGPGLAVDRLLLSLVLARTDRLEDARSLRREADDWFAENPLDDAHVRRLQAEAEALLGAERRTDR